MLLSGLLLPALALAIYSMEWFDLNRWKAPLYNDGRWGIDTIGGGLAGGSWPSPLHNCYIFGAGPWVGAIVPSVTPDTLTTMFYNPTTGGTEGCPTLCRHWRDGTGNSEDRIYTYPGDWPPPASRFPMAPQDPRSDMDMWCCYGDSDPARHDTFCYGRPLGIDVYLSAYGFSDSLAQDFFFLKYELANASGDSVRQAFFGMMLDADIGDATDDRSCLLLDRKYVVNGETIQVTNTGFAYDHNNVEVHGTKWDSGTPGAVAVMLLSAPNSLGLTALKRFSIDIDPVTDAAQYQTLAGYNYRTGEYQPYDTNWLSPADVRMLLATGPFDLAPDSIATFWYAIIASPFGDAGQNPTQRDTSDLVLRCKWARDFYDARLAGVAEQKPEPAARTAPAATIVRGVLTLALSPRPRVSESPCLLDACGRKVLDLRPGANDVSRLSPGVYFVHSSLANRQSTTTKVIVTR